MLWLGMHFPSLGLEIFSMPSSSMKKEDNNTPSILIENGIVKSRNYLAKKMGVLSGISASTAYSILPEANYYHRNIIKEEKRLRLLADTFYSYTSAISSHNPNSLLLEIESSLNLFNNKRKLILLIKERCDLLGHQVNLETGETPLEALLLARSREKHIEDISLDYIYEYVADSRENASYLCERLSNIGVNNIGELLRLPKKELASRFGNKVTNFLHQLTGQIPSPQNNIHPTILFKKKVDLANPISNKDDLKPLIIQLLKELEKWLIDRQLITTKIHWELRCSRKTSKAIDVSFSNAHQNHEAFLTLTLLRLENTYFHSDVLSIELSIDNSMSYDKEILELFATESKKRSSPQEVMDLLKTRLGDDALFGIKPTPNHLPENCWSKIEYRELKTNKKERPPTFIKEKVLKRPLWILRYPKKINPKDFCLLEGPERISENKYTDSYNYRDYYVAQEKHGAQCWVYRSTNTFWYLHGYFS